MSSTLSQQSFYEEQSPIPFYAESPETSRQLFKAATTPSPRVKRLREQRQRDREEVVERAATPKPEDSRSIQESDSTPTSRIIEADNEVDNIFAPKRSGSGEVPSGFGLGLGIPVLPHDQVDEPVIAWRFSEVSKQSSFAAPTSPSPTESVDGDAGPPGGDVYSIYTLTPGPAWPPPPSTEASPEQTPRNSLDVEISRQKGSGESTDFDGMPLSPLTPAITQLLDEISTMERPPSSNTSKSVTQVQAFVMDMPPMPIGRGRGKVRVRKMRSWRNLRALGTRTSQFELLRKTTLPSPPITPPGQGVEEEEEEQVPESSGYPHRTPTQLPDSPVEYPFYDDYEDFIEEHLDLAREESEEESELVEEEQGIVEQQQTPQPRVVSLDSDLADTPRPAVLDSPALNQETIEPITPDPNSDLVDEIEALLQSSPLRKQDAERAASNQSTPTQARIAEGMAIDPERTPTQLQPPTFNRNDTQETIASQATDSTVFYTPKEGRTPYVENPNPLDREIVPPMPVPVPVDARPQTPPPRASSSTHSTPTRPPIPTRRSSLSHSRNHSTETVPTKSYPPTAQRPGAHIRGKSIDSSSVYNDRGRTYPPSSSKQRSSSANDITVGEELRGRGRSRSIEDGPPQIPARKSSVGKTGKPSELLDSWIRKDSSEGPRRPSLGSIIGSHKISDESVERNHSRRFSFSSGVEILGVDEKAEVVNAGVVPSGSVKEVLVRTSSKGTKTAEFPEISVTSPTLETGKKPGFIPQHVPQFSFGEGPDLSFGETSASAGKGKERARDDLNPSLPPLFQLIPPTPAATEASTHAVRQLGYQPIQIPGTPVNGESSGRPMRQPTPVTIVHMRSATESTPSIPLPTRLHSVTQEVVNRPSTAPEPLIDFENTLPSLESPKRPSLKNRPTGFKKSKLSPWWKPKYEQHYRHYDYDYDDQDYDYLAQEGSGRPRTSGTITTITSNGGSGEGKRKKKQHKTVNLGKVQLEFVGVRGLRESYREMKEEKKRRKMLHQQKQQMANGVPNSPPRLDVRF